MGSGKQAYCTGQKKMNNKLGFSGFSAISLVK
jgi:hypothetical protein